jgi:hypothetical protein
VHFGHCGVGRDNGHRQWAGERRLPGLRVDEMVQRATWAEAPGVAARGGDSTGVQRENGERLPGTPRVGHRDEPRPAFGRCVCHGDVAAEVDEPAGEIRRGGEHRIECAPGSVALADSTEIDRGSGLEPRAAAPFVELDRGARAPVGRRGRRPLLEQLERAVVAGCHERGQHGGIEAAAGVFPGLERQTQRLE